jgi:hypothetical protein
MIQEDPTRTKIFLMGPRGMDGKTAGLTTASAIVLGIDHKTASYAKLIKWWAENSTNTAIYIGNEL